MLLWLWYAHEVDLTKRIIEGIYFKRRKRYDLEIKGNFLEERQIEVDDGVKHNWNKLAILDC